MHCITLSAHCSLQFKCDSMYTLCLLVVSSIFSLHSLPLVMLGFFVISLSLSCQGHPFYVLLAESSPISMTEM